MDMYTTDPTERNAQRVADNVQNASQSAGRVTQNVSEPMERGLSNEPANSLIRTICLAGAGGSILGSLAMQMTGRKHEALFIGQWAPTFIAIALWYQIVKSQRM